tara:strand:- start:33236 stop:33358 length:123 start_codon:yes stop_codon:yes gene_type:complete
VFELGFDKKASFAAAFDITDRLPYFERLYRALMEPDNNFL